MAQYASRILKLTIEKLQDRSVKEVRFLSGMNPAFVDNEGVTYLALGELSAERVGEIR